VLPNETVFLLPLLLQLLFGLILDILQLLGDDMSSHGSLTRRELSHNLFRLSDTLNHFRQQLLAGQHVGCLEHWIDSRPKGSMLDQHQWELRQPSAEYPLQSAVDLFPFLLELNKLQDDVILAIAKIQKLGRNSSPNYMCSS